MPTEGLLNQIFSCCFCQCCNRSHHQSYCLQGYCYVTVADGCHCLCTQPESFRFVSHQGDAIQRLFQTTKCLIRFRPSTLCSLHRLRELPGAHA